MHDGVDHRFEDRTFAELRYIRARGILVGRDTSVRDHEAQRCADLPVERATDVARVNLPVGVRPVPAITHRVDPGVRQPLARILRRQQDAAHGCPQRSLRVGLHELQLRQGDLGRHVRARAYILPPQFPLQAVDTGAVNYLRVSRCGVGLPARLRQPPDRRRIHLALCVSPSMEVPTRRTVHCYTLGYLDDEGAAAGRLRRRHLEHPVVERRLDGVRADSGHQVRQCVQLHRIESLRLPVVRHSQHEPPSAGVAERRQLVGERIPPRRGDLPATELDRLQLQVRILA